VRTCLAEMFPSCLTLRARAGVMRFAGRFKWRDPIEGRTVRNLRKRYNRFRRALPLATRTRSSAHVDKGNCASCRSFFRTLATTETVEEADGERRPWVRTVQTHPSVGKHMNRKHFLLACRGFWSECGVGTQRMADPSYTLFNKTTEQLRLLGARGGRAFGRNQRARRALNAIMPTPSEAATPRVVAWQTAAEAITLLDSQFPWLSGAENRHSSRMQIARRHGPHITSPSMATV
jgi:hypothetical protein